MTTPLRTLAPAKINLTLEILGRRDDGFHDLASVAHTLDLADTVRLAPPAPDDITARRVDFRDESGNPLPAPQAEIVARTWAHLCAHTGRDLPGRVTIQKRIPIAAGLGGGSSDAAAFLRLANQFWDLALSPNDLASIGATVGSDVPLLLHGGALLMQGRGERITPLPDTTGWIGLLFTPELPLPAAKTATMFSALRPRHFSDGARTHALAAKLAQAQPPSPEDLFNSFDTIVGEVLIGVAAHRRRFATAARAVPILAGAGPSLFLVTAPSDLDAFAALATQLSASGGRAQLVHPLSRHHATAVQPVSVES
ncbi:MAG: 4-diphosphocytidyl-2-C-methyl-D-erythritol kinase [Chloroflexi bacterium]|nr:MAG: 4-diphosphocytidyl-2-C-methyl-D-erythritol kinase [Chloroflexota bacterium]